MRANPRCWIPLLISPVRWSGSPEKPTSHEGVSGGYGYRQGIQRRRCTLRRGLGDEPNVAGGRGLTLGEGVNLVVVDQVGDVMIPPHGVKEMVTAFSVAIAVASHRDDGQLGIGDLGPGGGGRVRPCSTFSTLPLV